MDIKMLKTKAFTAVVTFSATGAQEPRCNDISVEAGPLLLRCLPCSAG
jgi:hypothetical protein